MAKLDRLTEQDFEELEQNFKSLKEQNRHHKECHLVRAYNQEARRKVRQYLHEYMNRSYRK